jgi:hypothetical protein
MVCGGFCCSKGFYEKQSDLKGQAIWIIWCILHFMGKTESLHLACGGQVGKLTRGAPTRPSGEMFQVDQPILKVTFSGTIKFFIDYLDETNKEQYRDRSLLPAMISFFE